MDTFEKIKEAREILNIGDRASIREIRESYLKLLKKYHPDTGEGDPDFLKHMTTKIVAAYNLLMDYCYNFKISFSKEDICTYLRDEEWWLHRFGEDPLWGRYGEEYGQKKD